MIEITMCHATGLRANTDDVRRDGWGTGSRALMTLFASDTDDGRRRRLAPLMMANQWTEHRISVEIIGGSSKMFIAHQVHLQGPRAYPVF